MQSEADTPAAPFENDLHRNVERSLCETGYPEHRTLTVKVEHGTVLVEGILPTWFMRQIAVECIRRVAGVSGVVDRIQVRT